MSEATVNIEAIILEAYGCKDVHELQKYYDISVQMMKEICIEAVRQTLELAAENAEATIVRELVNPTKPTSAMDFARVDKQSILKTINQIK